jgi:hypothetical protein
LKTDKTKQVAQSQPKLNVLSQICRDQKS